MSANLQYIKKHLCFLATATVNTAKQMRDDLKGSEEML